jgi:hypothetical protein
MKRVSGSAPAESAWSWISRGRPVISLVPAASSLRAQSPKRDLEEELSRVVAAIDVVEVPLEQILVPPRHGAHRCALGPDLVPGERTERSMRGDHRDANGRLLSEVRRSPRLAREPVAIERPSHLRLI